jgi:hypothetical protein
MPIRYLRLVIVVLLGFGPISCDPSKDKDNGIQDQTSAKDTAGQADIIAATDIPDDNVVSDKLAPDDTSALDDTVDSQSTDIVLPDIVPDTEIDITDVFLDMEDDADINSDDTAGDTTVWLQCPDEPAEPGSQCSGDFKCDYGEECCCGECDSSYVCDCIAGQFACYNTDFCYGSSWCSQIPCCLLDDDDSCLEMGEEYVCLPVESNDTYGKCFKPAKYPGCWHNSQCEEGESCKSPNICPCDAECFIADIPGSCIPDVIPEGCCLEDTDCNNGLDNVFVCSFTDFGNPTPFGRCMWIPTDDQCWDDADCTAEEICDGAMFCPCGMGCGMADMPGNCINKSELGGVGDACGPDGGPCQKELACCYPCGIPDCTFQCSVPCDEAEVWCSDGCAMMP